MVYFDANDILIRMNKSVYIVLISLLAFCSTVQAQTYVLQARIVEEGSGTPLPFVTIFNKTQFNGTASNPDGFFVLPNNQLGDTIVVAFLGYQEKLLVVTAVMSDVITLSRQSAILGEIVVTAESDYLYDLVLQVRNQKRTKTKTSKTYFFLETLLYNEPIEIIEAYYNGAYSDHGIDILKIKKGRIGLKPINGRYYRSTESSSLFSLHDVYAKSYLFPESPLAMKIKELKKNYILSLNYTFNADQSEVYVIDIVPRNERKDLFGSTVWIDRTNHRLVKVSLRIKNASLHPFIPIGLNTIEQVDMEINKTYETIHGEQFINTIDFNYNIAYVDTIGNKVKATTRAFTKAYDYQNQFRLPWFEFTPHLHEDYRNMTMVPYDSMFWQRTTEFRFYDRLSEIEDFIAEHKIENQVIHRKTRKDSMHAQLQFAYIPWDTIRFTMRQAGEEVIANSMRTRPFDVDRYHLNIKLYMDINVVKDTFLAQLYSVLDPVNSFYHFLITDENLAFMNMWFDLMEIEKRAFVTELSALHQPNEDIVERLYQKHLRQFEESRKQLVADVNRGDHWINMSKWNDYIQQALGVNNLKWFHLQEPE